MTNTTIFQGMELRRKQYRLLVLLLACLLFGLVVLNMTVGSSATYSPLSVLRILFGDATLKGGYIIKSLRLPRTLAAIFCGIAFGVAGNTFQTLLGNPLASPDIIGVSTGSSVAAVYGILFLQLHSGRVSFLALLAGLLTSGLIYALSIKGGYSAARLILTGIGTQAFFASLINWMLQKGAEYDVPTAMRWMAGNLNEIPLESLYLFIPIVLITACVIGLMGNTLKGLELGDAYATVLGIPVNASRILLIGLAVVLIAFATSVSGPIASVSFLSGPIATRLGGKAQTNTLSAGLIGAIIVISADFVGQNLLPVRYPVGVITGLLGAPYLLYLLMKMNKGEKV